jgi:phosphatidylethanolamine/phosphatidyl-N-methylethanolamine N-methyltransferase
MLSRSSWKFFRNFLKSPFQMGGVVPSSRFLARAVAESVRDLLVDESTPIIEIGPGTGALTEELSRFKNPLVLLERNPDFSRELSRRFPVGSVVCEDFLTTSIFSTGTRGSIVVSSLPIRSLPHPELFRARFQELVERGAIRAIVQYSYGWRDPLELPAEKITASRRRFVVLNFPPAFVWSYRLKQ